MRPAPSKLAIVLLAVAASFTSLANGFAHDDVALIANDWRVHRLSAPVRFFAQPYWPHSTLYRPLTSLAFALEWSLGGGAPWVYHAVNVVLYALVCLLVFRLARRLLGERAGWWATALFAVHPVHTEAVANAVGQSELWAALLVILALDHYVAVRRTRDLRLLDVAWLTVLYGSACLFKEHALMLPGLLLAAEVTVLGGNVRDVVRWRELTLLGAALALTAAAYWSAHAVVVGTFVGETAAVPLQNLRPLDRLLTMLGVVPEWFRLLLLPAHLQADYMPQELPLAHGLGGRQMAGVFFLLLSGFAAARSRRKHPALTFAVCWLAITLFPVSNLAFPTGILLAERTLFLPSVGAALAAGVAITWVMERVDAAPRVRRAAFSAGAAILLAGMVRSALRQPAWRDGDAFVSHLLVDAPRSYKVHWIQAHRLAALGKRAEVEGEYRLALGLYPDDPRLLAEMADRYSTMKRCADALPLYRRSLAIAGRVVYDPRRYARCFPPLTETSPPLPPP